MNNLQLFKNPEFGQVRVIEQDGEPWFVGKDVAAVLGYSNQNRDIVRHVDEDDRIMLGTGEGLDTEMVLSLGQRGGWFINESGLYSLILSSKLPTAKQFKRWVTSEILPSIRKHGGYIAGQEVMNDDELLEKALLVAKNRIREREKQIKEMTPKAIFADAVAASHTSILIGDLAKLLKQNGVEIGQKRLFEWLRDNGYLIRQKGSSWNMPTQYSMERGLFEVKETTVTHADGHISISKTPKVTGKGQVYFVRKFVGGERYGNNGENSERKRFAENVD